jgi:hypothetical protein
MPDKARNRAGELEQQGRQQQTDDIASLSPHSPHRSPAGYRLIRHSPEPSGHANQCASLAEQHMVTALTQINCLNPPLELCG